MLVNKIKNTFFYKIISNIREVVNGELLIIWPRLYTSSKFSVKHYFKSVAINFKLEILGKVL